MSRKRSSPKTAMIGCACRTRDLASVSRNVDRSRLDKLFLSILSIHHGRNQYSRVAEVAYKSLRIVHQHHAPLWAVVQVMLHRWRNEHDTDLCEDGVRMTPASGRWRSITVYCRCIKISSTSTTDQYRQQPFKHPCRPLPHARHRNRTTMTTLWT